MTWVKLDDGFAEHPKVIELSDAAFRLHVTALCYCGRRLTDGAVPNAIAGKSKAVSELVEAGLWTTAAKGYQINDFLQFNPSKAEVEEQREKRARAGRKGAASRWQGTSDGTCHDTPHGSAHAERIDMSMPPTRPDPYPSKETPVLVTASTADRNDSPEESEVVPSSAPVAQKAINAARRSTKGRQTVTPMFKKGKSA